MKAFLVGLLFMFVVAVLSGIGFLLFPLLMVLSWLLRVILIGVLLILAIWLLGKFVLYAWGKMR